MRRSLRTRQQPDFYSPLQKKSFKVKTQSEEKEKPFKLMTKPKKNISKSKFFSFMLPSLNPEEFRVVTAEEIINSEYNNLLHNNMLSVLGPEYLERAPLWFVKKYNMYKSIRIIYNKDYTEPAYLENIIL